MDEEEWVSYVKPFAKVGRLAMEMVSNVHGRNLVAWAKDKTEILVLSADLTGSTEIGLFRNIYPERFVSIGVAEQNMMSIAGGLARERFYPFVHTFAVFIYRRAYDQIAMSIAYPNLPVRIFGFLPGITTPGGATHQAIEDIALMRALPNMIVLECGDATDVESVLDVAQSVDGPVYIRMLRGEMPRLFSSSDPMELGRARVLSTGKDILILSSGICTEQALTAIPTIQRKGISVQHMHVSTLKPFDDPSILESIATVRFGVITMENHTIIGGLGTCVAERMAELGTGKRLIRIGIQDTFAHGGSKEYLMKKYGIDGATLLRRVGDLVNEKFELGNESFQESSYDHEMV